MLVTNGFTRKPHTLQITGYILFIGDALVFYLFLVPLLSDPLKIAASISEFFPVTLSIYFAYYCTKSDPTDTQVTEFRRSLAQGKAYLAESREFYCTECTTYVSEKSRHCKRCERCVENFDHHCKWINNCIGKSNYKQFFCLIVSVLIFSGVFIAFTVVATVEFAQNRFENLKNTYSQSSGTDIGLIIVVWIFSVPTILMFILDLNLIALHLYLTKKKMTTLEYILYVREKKELKQQMEEEQKNVKSQERIKNKAPQSDERTCFDCILCIKPKKRASKQPQDSDSRPQNNALSDVKTKIKTSEKSHHQSGHNPQIRGDSAFAVLRDHASNLQQQDDILSQQFNKEAFPSITNRNSPSHDSERGLTNSQIIIPKNSENKFLNSVSNKHQENPTEMNIIINHVNQNTESNREHESIAIKKIGHSASQVKLLLNQVSNNSSQFQGILAQQVTIKSKSLSPKQSDKLLMNKTDYDPNSMGADLSLPYGDSQDVQLLGEIDSGKVSRELNLQGENSNSIIDIAKAKKYSFNIRGADSNPDE